ncbi:MAG: radical SAM protein [Actinobacteria bacterium]|nr:radical SAM protein [Actinomycetota bacterium]
MTTETARDRLRWSLADRQPRLFDDEHERITYPEFAGIEFLHVRAKTIINQIPSAAHLPFEHTINVYRGCSHGCSFCLDGATPILMADGRTRPLADIRPGDVVYGTRRDGSYRRYVQTEVRDHWSTVKPAFKIRLADGTGLIASGEHRFLTNRGWKHVTGSDQGRRRRPHLTLQNSLLGTGGFAEAPKDDAEYRRGYLVGMIRGDGSIGSYSYAYGDVHRFRLALADREALDRSVEYLRDYALHLEPYVFHEATDTTRQMLAVRASSRDVVEFIRELVAWPRRAGLGWSKGFLAGMFDAEGSYSAGVLRIANTDSTILERIVTAANSLGFDTVLEPARANGCRTVRLRGGLREHLRFFLTVDPAITRKRVPPPGYALKSDADLRVVEIAPLGIDIPMYDVTTGTGDFIANGVVSHNCFARPTHRYLDLDPGEDFHRVIVVKINAVEKLRAELASPRWSGATIAMGTNTDPYQRAEGRYELTRGVIGELTRARNPFSILTRSPLITRDLDLLVEAASSAPVSTAFSIGTLDEELWRSLEPGAPHPRGRLEAVASLREAGLPVGVMVAPILPGLTDNRAHLEPVVRAAVEAGATSITPIVLHLRPGVREHYLGWLREHRPDLLTRYEQLYARGSYAEKAARTRIAGRVHALVRELGGPRART